MCNGCTSRQGGGAAGAAAAAAANTTTSVGAALAIRRSPAQVSEAQVQPARGCKPTRGESPASELGGEQQPLIATKHSLQDSAAQHVTPPAPRRLTFTAAAVAATVTARGRLQA